MSDVNNTLAQRAKTHGAFSTHAQLSQQLKSVIKTFVPAGASTPSWERLSDTQREALDMIMHKTARILNGDPDEPDHWHDIAGYSELVKRELTEVTFEAD